MPLNKNEQVSIVEYDSRWPVEFSKLARVLKRFLGDSHEKIEHVGSTAVPGLAAKPILDIDIVISGEDKLPVVRDKLAQLEYSFEGEKGISQRWAFRRKDEKTPNDGSKKTWMDHHLYVCPRESRELKRHLFLREFLRNHPQKVQEYGELKKDFSRKFGFDRIGYTEAKTEFLEGILEKGAPDYNLQKALQ